MSTGGIPAMQDSTRPRPHPARADTAHTSMHATRDRPTRARACVRPAQPRALSMCVDDFYGKRSFSVTTPCARPTRVNTERLAERETLLHRLGSKLNRTVLNSCGNSLSVPQKHVTFPTARFFCEQSHFHEIDYFWKHQTINSRLRHSF